MEPFILLFLFLLFSSKYSSRWQKGNIYWLRAWSLKQGLIVNTQAPSVIEAVRTEECQRQLECNSSPHLPTKSTPSLTAVFVTEPAPRTVYKVSSSLTAHSESCSSCLQLAPRHEALHPPHCHSPWWHCRPRLSLCHQQMRRFQTRSGQRQGTRSWPSRLQGMKHLLFRIQVRDSNMVGLQKLKRKGWRKALEFSPGWSRSLCWIYLASHSLDFFSNMVLKYS